MVKVHETEGKWVWTGNDLIDERGEVVASVISDVIYLGDQRLLIESSTGPWHFRTRATHGDGTVFTLNQKSLTTARLIARCATRTYSLDRTSIWRKERLISNSEHQPCALINPRVSGKVEVADAPGYAPIPLVDAVFLTWGCVLADSPVRKPGFKNSLR